MISVFFIFFFFQILSHEKKAKYQINTRHMISLTLTFLVFDLNLKNCFKFKKKHFIFLLKLCSIRYSTTFFFPNFRCSTACKKIRKLEFLNFFSKKDTIQKNSFSIFP